MSEFVPCEIVLDYELDEIRFDGTPLPFALTAVQAKAVIENGRSLVTVVLEVDQVRSVARLPEIPAVSVDKPPRELTPDEQFARQMRQAREANSR